jgi:hypothetical protein
MAGVGWEAVAATSEFRRRASSESSGEGAPLTKPLTQRALAGDLRGVASGTGARAGSGAAAAGAHATATAGEFPDTLERRVPKTLGTTLGVPPATDRSVRSGGTCSGPGPQLVETVHIDRGRVWTPTVRGGSSLRRGRLRESIGSQPVVLSFGSSGGASVWMEASHATVCTRDACVAASHVLGARGGGGVVGGGGGGAGGKQEVAGEEREEELERQQEEELEVLKVVVARKAAEALAAMVVAVVEAAQRWLRRRCVATTLKLG